MCVGWGMLLSRWPRPGGWEINVAQALKLQATILTVPAIARHGIVVRPWCNHVGFPLPRPLFFLFLFVWAGLSLSAGDGWRAGRARMGQDGM